MRRRFLSAPLLLAGLGPATATAADPPVPPPAPVPTAPAPLAPAANPVFLPPEAVQSLPPVAAPKYGPPEVFVKKAGGRFTALAGGDDDLGMDTLEADAVIGFARLPQFTVSPWFGVTLLDGPDRTDLPSRLYASQVELKWFGQIGIQYAYEFAVSPSVYTDGDNVGSDAFRLPARALGYMFLSERTQVAAGVVYLDREDVDFLPAVGLIHSPRDDVKFELVFPRPRILKRVGTDSSGETWAYLAGEFGGGSWAIERVNGAEDVVSYRDYRAILGLELRGPTEGSPPLARRWTAAVEAGYVFAREVEYESGVGDYDPDDTFLLRLALSR